MTTATVDTPAGATSTAEAARLEAENPELYKTPEQIRGEL
jgi:hypothetical protein